MWFLAAVVMGIPLGIVGATAFRPSRTGLVAALVLPLGAIAEVLYLGYFDGLAHPHWPTGVGQLGAGGVLTLAGTLGVILACRGWWKAQSAAGPMKDAERTPIPTHKSI